MRQANLKAQEQRKRLRAKRTRHNIKSIEEMNFRDHETDLDRLYG